MKKTAKKQQKPQCVVASASEKAVNIGLHLGGIFKPFNSSKSPIYIE
jgi:hypothetical protein